MLDRGFNWRHYVRTTVNIPEELLQEVQQLSRAGTRREALVIALEDYVRRQRLRRVMEAGGSLEFELAPREIRRQSNRRLRGAEE